MEIRDIRLRISGLCEKRSWSYYRLAKEAGFEQSSLKSITKEKNMPSLYTLEKICKAFGITLSEFFDDEIFRGGYGKAEFLSLWDGLDFSDRERVMIYMYGLSHKDIPKETNHEIR